MHPGGHSLRKKITINAFPAQITARVCTLMKLTACLLIRIFAIQNTFCYSDNNRVVLSS